MTDEYTTDVSFWERLKAFISKVQVNDAMSEEEKEFLIYVSDQKIWQLSQPREQEPSFWGDKRQKPK